MIVLNDLTKIYTPNKYTQITAIQNINLQVNQGEMVLLKGASGSGKSTILSLIAGLSKPTSGEVIVHDQHISKLPDDFASTFRQTYIGFIFQKYNLIPNLTVQENILLPLVPQNLETNEAKALLHEVMTHFKIEHKKDEMVKNLSGGEQQRVAIARSQINHPKIVIADEPTANLDKALSLHFIDTLKELKSQGKTIIVATHDPLFFNLDFCDRTIELSNGEIIS
ncbi:MAG: ABC transporter ATP-binding protein [Candidatus Marinarcus sp.]|uniref:ABC transporter ATP-binding protein n=1 Tax=Candidatus Marinarcus sp. TaxID=3100987 RepID=UPI003AFF9ABC